MYWLLRKIRSLLLKVRGTQIHKIDTSKEFRSAVSILLKQAKDSISIVSGELNSQVYDNVCDNLRSAFARGVKVRILTGPHIDIQSSRLLELAKAGRINIRRRTQRAVSHFIIFDGKYVIVSEPHEPFANRTSRIISNRRLVKEYQLLFEKEWSKCDAVNWSMPYGGFKLISRNLNYQIVTPARTEKISNRRHVLGKESRINGTISHPLTEPFRIYCDWNYFKRIRGGLESLGGSALGFGISVGVSKSLEKLFWNKIRSKKNRLKELTTLKHKKEVVVTGRLASVKPKVLTRMEGALWRLYVLKEGTAFVPVLMKEGAFEIMWEQVDKIDCSVTVYGELRPGRIFVMCQEKMNYIKARAAVIM